MKDIIEQLIRTSLANLGIEAGDFAVEHPSDLSHGDYSTSVALSAAKSAGKNPKALAEELVNALRQAQGNLDFLEKVEIAGPGFINFYLSRGFFTKSVGDINEKGSEFGKNESLKGEKVIVEHTDPNPFKEFHIGHLMPNVVGSTLANIHTWNGAEVKQASYQGDVGMHVAKSVYGMLKDEPEPYVFGSKAFEESDEAKKEITEINKKIYARSDDEINALYDKGRAESLAYFDTIYRKLGTNFDFFFFESEAAPIGKRIVEENMGKVFEAGENGAIVFHAEKYDEHLHTRVFINSEGLPTYEAKELGLAKMKAEKYPYTKSIVVTANEINEYFKVLLTAMRQIFPDLAAKTKHISHGLLRLSTGKMSSRTGDVITFLELLDQVKEKVKGDEAVAIGAIKYMILRQSIGGDIIFDVDKSVSTEGDSGVYLQYAHARANSILEKAANSSSPAKGRVGGVYPGKTPSALKGVSPLAGGEGSEPRTLEKLLYRFPEVVERSLEDYAPHHIVTYLTELAGAFNNFYAHEQVLNDEPESAYRLALVQAFKTVLKNGLDILGVPAPEKM